MNRSTFFFFLFFYGAFGIVAIFAQTEKEIFDAAKLAIDSGNVKKALNLFTQLPLKNTTNSYYLSNKAYCEYQLKQFKTCINTCNTALLLNPKLYDKYYLMKLRGIAKEELGLWKEAIKDYDEYLSLFFDDEEIAYRKAFAYYEQNKDVEAIEQFRYVLKLKTLTQKYRTLSYSKIGFCYLSMDSIDLAKEYRDKAIESDSMALNPMYLDADISYRAKMFVEAIEKYRLILEIDSTAHFVYVGMSSSFNSMSLFDSTVHYLKIYQQKVGRDVDFIYAMAETERLRKNPPAALRYYRDYLKENPNSSVAFNRVAWNVMILGNYTESLVYANKSIRQDNTNIHAYYTRGVINCKLKLYKDAINDFNKVISSVLSGPNSYYFRGLAYCKIRETEKACNDWQVVRKSNSYQTPDDEKPVEVLINENCK